MIRFCIIGVCVGIIGAAVGLQMFSGPWWVFIIAGNVLAVAISK